ncbi:MAG: iron ABC transporter permease, partial [Coriobacteriales bacterium]|nr:iron ABC transporter permease [Coriobacteriales bacterium]
MADDTLAAPAPAPAPASARSRGLEVARKNDRSARLFILGLAILMVVLVCVSLMLGRYPIEPVDAFKMLINRIIPLEQTWGAQAEVLFFNVRFPRILMALMVGACLAAAGAAFQGTFQNPLASPDILGASQGAALGAAIAILAGASAHVISATAFVFSMSTIVLVFLISSRAKGNRIMVTVLAGVMVSSLFSSGVSFTKLVADPTDQLPAITYWLMGSLTSVRLHDVAIAALPMALGCA